MDDIAISPLRAWESFYVIIGSSAAALTGLQFVVVALVAEARTRSSSREIAAFGTPTVVHFCAVLLVSAVLSAPWKSLSNPGIVLAVAGVAGMVYAVLVVRRARRQTGYHPVLEDWIWHAILPFLAYGALLVSALLLPPHPISALFLTAGSALVLLFDGIHNAWDAVTWIAVVRWQPPSTPPEQG